MKTSTVCSWISLHKAFRMLGLSVLCVVSWSAWNQHSLMQPRAATVRRAAGITAQEKPFKSDDEFDYFRQPKQLSVTLTKPLGAVIVDCAPAGVRVDDLQDGGSAATTGLLKKGDRIRTVQGEDVSQAGVDAVMEKLVAAPAEVEIGVLRFVVVRKPKEAIAPTTLTVDGKKVEVQKGVILRTAAQAAGADLYKGVMAKMQQCGGVGQCSLCWVEVTSGMDNLSPKTAVEEEKGTKRPANYRMACQSVINGDVCVKVP